jgi:VWFA-related protein
MNLAVRTTLLLLFTLPLAAPLAAQRPAPPDAITPGPTKIPNTVLLDVVVTGHNNKPVAGLTQSNFTILNNGSPQQILSFKAVQSPSTDPPIQLYLLLDTVNAPITAIAREREEITTFLHRSGETLPYPLSFVILSDTGISISESPSNNTTELLAELNSIDAKLRTITRSTGYWGAVERVQISLKSMQDFATYAQSKPGRKILIWISPGWAYLSGPNIDLTNKDEAQLFNNIVGLSTQLELGRVALYSIDPIGVLDAASTRITYWEDFVKPVPAPKNTAWADLSLQVLAVHTGGRVLNSSNDLASQIQSAIDDTLAFYVITIPRAPADKPNQLNVIQVKIPDTTLKPHTLFGFYSQP